MSTDLLEQIKIAYEQDMRHAAPAILASALPLSYEAISDEWLTNVLCRGTPGAQVIGHRLGEIDNGSANRRKLYPVYNQAGRQAGLPEALFCKATHDLPNRIVQGMSGGARCEVLFYNSIRPLLDIETPHCYHANLNDRSFNSIIMLNDLSDAVSEFCDHTTVISRARAESQMELLARMHGSVYGSPHLQDQLRAFPSWSQFFRSTLGFGMKEGSEKGFLAAESVIPPSLYRRFDEIWPATLTSVAAHENVPHTLAHGDVHLKNWYVATNGEMGLSDWQCCGGGMWGRDLAYTISTALTPEDRRAWERELVQLYLERLHAAGGPSISFNEGFTIYRQQLISALTWWTVTLTPPPGLPDMQPRDTTLEFIRRIAIAIDDLESLDAFEVVSCNP